MDTSFVWAKKIPLYFIYISSRLLVREGVYWPEPSSEHTKEGGEKSRLPAKKMSAGFGCKKNEVYTEEVVVMKITAGRLVLFCRCFHTKGILIFWDNSNDAKEILLENFRTISWFHYVQLLLNLNTSFLPMPILNVLKRLSRLKGSRYDPTNYFRFFFYNICVSLKGQKYKKKSQIFFGINRNFAVLF